MDKSDIRFILDLSLRQISLNSIFRPVHDSSHRGENFMETDSGRKGKLLRVILAGGSSCLG